MKKINISRELFIRNRSRLVKELKPGAVAIISANDELTRSGDQNYPYRQNSDLFYLTGLEQEKCMLVLCPGHPDKNLREIVFTVKPDANVETWGGHQLTKQEIGKISGVQTVKWLDQFDLIIRDLIIQSEYVYLNSNEYVKYQTEVVYQSHRLICRLKDQFPLHHFERLAPILVTLRTIKQTEEINLIKEACSITDSAFRRVLKFVKPGVSEYEIEAEITHEFITKGARGHAYEPIIGSGKNAMILHYTENSETCKDGDLVLMDFGAEVGNYAADCSRTIPVNGKFTDRQKACYEAVLRVQKEAMKLYVPGNSCNDINKAVWKMMEKEMIVLGLFTENEVKKQNPDNPLYTKYLMHGVAHFIGLDVHDVGSKYQKLEKGMVITCEPGLYIKEEGIGIRIENDILVDNIPVDLMAHIPREIDEIEELMITNS
ncbi:MAG: aminopeptidase P N-terminal domain-containing protein [Bacteroidales bacterium]|nr:aminopeptidase P N-terminal domain-containing protein [Bacteroidales bacterium]